MAGSVPSPSPQPDMAQGEQTDGDPEHVDGHRRHCAVVEGIDQHQRPADEVERLIGHAVAGQPAGGDEAISQQESGRAYPAAEFNEEFIHFAFRTVDG